jgi:hypothetical protein
MRSQQILANKFGMRIGGEEEEEADDFKYQVLQLWCLDSP